MSLRHSILASVVVLLPVAAFAETRTVCKTGGSGLNIRSAPSIHAGKTGGIVEGDDFQMLGLSRNGAWVKVKSGGRTGWVSRNYVCNAGGSNGTGSANAGGNSRAGGSSIAGGSSSSGASNGGGSGSSSSGVANGSSGVAPDSSSGPSNGGFVNPVPGSCRSSSYGNRRDPFHGTTRFHDGADFAAPNGTPLRSAFTGTVVRAGQVRGYGYAVVVRRDNADGSSTFALYGHMCCGKGSRLGKSSIKVRVGQRVEAGQVIGQVGTTGRSTGPHLHMLMRKVPAGVSSAYRNPSSSSFFSKRYTVNPEGYISIGGCGNSRRGIGGDDHDHDHEDKADDAAPAGLSR